MSASLIIRAVSLLVLLLPLSVAGSDPALAVSLQASPTPRSEPTTTSTTTPITLTPTQGQLEELDAGELYRETTISIFKELIELRADGIINPASSESQFGTENPRAQAWQLRVEQLDELSEDLPISDQCFELPTGFSVSDIVCGFELQTIVAYIHSQNVSGFDTLVGKFQLARICYENPTLDVCPSSANVDSPEAQLVASPTTLPQVTRYVIGNTDGAGAHVRRSAGADESLKAWPEGTEMIVVGPDVTRLWRNVRDPDGNIGFVPAEYLVLPALVMPRQASVPSDIPAYDRDQWRHWIDADGDCQDTRQEVLIAESTTQVGFKTAKKCRVASGTWDGPFTGRQFTDPSDLDIDHMVPLKNAHLSGGSDWDKATKRRFANDLSYDGHLNAVLDSENSSKGSRGPEDWKPPDRSYWCEYATHWIKIKVAWDLTATQRELEALKQMLDTCESPPSVNVGTPPAESSATPAPPTATIAPPTATTAAQEPTATAVPATATRPAPAPTATAVPATATPIPETTPTAVPANATPPATNDALALYDDNGNGRITCAEARRHGIAPVHRGHIAYPFMNDRDNDGVVCE